ncbi:MAG: M1 family metallopeptidase [Vicinamibacterales bacterium]
MRKIPVVTLALLLTATTVWAQRLPTDVVPLHYDITVAPDLAAAKFTGEQRIRVRLDKASSAIVLNAAEITFRDVRVTAGGKMFPATVSLDASKEQATIRVDTPIPAGEAEVAIRYDGVLNDDLRGLYLSRANNRRYAVTQLEATDARRMFPSFDEPAFKATFALTAIIDAKDRAISNGAIVSDTPGPTPGRHTVTFETTPKMSTYLVALTVGDFECNEGSADGIPVRICATPDKKHLTTFALEAAIQQVEFFNKYYSIKYPFKKLDVVAVPDFAAGAMENTAAIFYRETLLLADERASVGVRKDIAKVLAHEIAHQWFGDLVTMAWWDDIWLNEGFANWMMSKPLKAWRPDWHVELDEVEDNHTAMTLDALRSTRPIRSTASTPAEIAELFDPIAYEKGAAVLRMLEAWVGEEPFQKAVNAYIERFKYSNARAEDFWSTLAKVTGKPVDRVMPTFVDQPGLPLVTIGVRCTGQSAEVALSQERYVQDASPRGAGTSKTDQVWQIPICIRTATGATTCEVLSEKRHTVAVDSCPAWVMGNAGARGYYRSAIQADVVRELSHEVARLAPAERMAVLADEWALARAGRHDVGTTMDLASGFGKERTPDVWQTLASILASVDEDLATGATRKAYRPWVARLLSPTLSDIGTTARPSDTDETKALRATLVSVMGRTARDATILANARDLVRQELETRGSVEPTLLRVVVDLAAIEGDAALYDQYLARSKAAVDPEERYQYLHALTSFTNPALVRRTMALVVSPDVRSQDAKLVLARMLTKSDTRDLAWDLLRERWTEIQKKTGEFVGNTVIVGALGSFCDAGTADEVQKFFSTNKLPDAERTLQQSIETVRSCARFAQAQQPKLAEWLKGL